jgi:hypothetical protein
MLRPHCHRCASHSPRRQDSSPQATLQALPFSSLLVTIPPVSTSSQAATPMRTHEAFWPQNLFEKGIGWVVATRFKSGGQRIQSGVFLVNVWCLGVKRAVYDEWTPETYRSHILDHYFSQFPMTEIQPACARKLVEQAVQYALQLGFAPHPDYRKTARVFGGVRVEDCPQQFVFGHQGKPFYIQGPNDSEAQALQIVRQLHQRCGPGHYDYLIEVAGNEKLERFFRT